jgi:hypothetical protein
MSRYRGLSRRNRRVLSVLMAAGVAVLMIWQAVRTHRMNECREAGGVWQGRESRCIMPPGHIILRRGIERS